jgi:transglutaminase-like putative cysteine protease
MNGVDSVQAQRAARTITLPHLAPLFAGILLTLAPHAVRLPIWITAISVGLIAWRGWAAHHGERLPRKWLIFLLVMAGLFAVYMSNRTLVGRDAGVTMLVMFLGLKLLETKQERDVIVVTFLCYFLALTNFFYGQSIVTALHTLLTVIILTAALVGFNAVQCPWRHNLRTAAVLLAQAVPLMLVLFILFPRFNGPLWGLPDSAAAGMTGLSDTMAPGTISKLSQSDAVAFRVKFEDAPPARHFLYWRGPTLDEFDGRTWYRAPRSALHENLQLSYRSKPLFYEVTLEPHNQRWLFGLEMAAVVPPQADYTQQYELVSRQPVQQRVRYRLASYVDYVADSGASAAAIERDLKLPPGLNPQTMSLGQQWRAELNTPQAVLARAMGFFRDQGLRYTLTPPPLGRDSVDEFLFQTKSGFCEHFSAAFVVLMRAAGVPARVVTGYQGGETNPVDGYMIVRQSDAHAWAEVWLGERGWVRVDPTAIANPIRIEQGLAQAVPPGDPVPFMIRADFTWLARLRHNWEAVANTWNQWVLGYNMDRQRDFLAHIGMHSPNLEKLVNAMLWSIGLALGIVVFFMLRNARPREPATVLWQRFCRRVAQRGVARAPHEGPADYVERVSRKFPEVRDEASAVANAYIALRYGYDPRDAFLLSELRRCVKDFRI